MEKAKEEFLRKLLIDWPVDYMVEEHHISSIDDLIECYCSICSEADITLDNESITYLRKRLEE